MPTDYDIAELRLDVMWRASPEEIRERYGDEFESGSTTYRWCDDCEDFHRGNGHPETAISNADGVCPICGDDYSSYLTHITEECDGRE